ncbi:glycosyl hydrolases family 31-domain-containing protein [Suillus tomentosus]|nr:glycosyl hydrolases family 31-domain-containing protein [Suillus tomentosus]
MVHRPNVTAPSIIAQSVCSPELRNVYKAHEAFGILWRLSGDDSLPGPATHWRNTDAMQFEGTYQVLEPVLRDLLDPSIHRIFRVSRVNGKEIRGFVYERSFNQHYVAHLEILLSIVSIFLDTRQPPNIPSHHDAALPRFCADGGPPVPTCPSERYFFYRRLSLLTTTLAALGRTKGERIYKRTTLQFRKNLELKVLESVIEYWYHDALLRSKDFYQPTICVFGLVDVLITNAQSAVHMISSISLRISNTSERTSRITATAFDQPADILLGFVIDPTPFDIVRPVLLDSIIDLVTQVPNPFGPKPHPPSSKLPPVLDPEQAQLDPYSSLAENTNLTLQEKITDLQWAIDVSFAFAWRSCQMSTIHWLFLSSAGSDIFLQTPPNFEVLLIQYHVVGGILDFYFFSGPSDAEVIAQYGSVIGYPMWQPAWGFGFHLCRRGYHNVSDDIANVAQMRTAGIPLEVQWNDFDLYHAYRDFTADPVSFSGDELRAFIRELAANNRHCKCARALSLLILIELVNRYPHCGCVEEDVWIKNPDGSLYLGQVWPGYTVYPDWFSENILSVWTEGLRNWTEMGVEFSGLWLDMNEPSSFCSNSCGTGANYSALAPLSVAGTVVAGYPECYNETIWGPTGNMTINGTSTDSCTTGSATTTWLKDVASALVASKASISTAHHMLSIMLSDPLTSTLWRRTRPTHFGGYAELDVHNMFGFMEEKTTHLAINLPFCWKMDWPLGILNPFDRMGRDVNVSDSLVTTSASGSTCTSTFKAFYSSKSTKFRWLALTLVDSMVTPTRSCELDAALGIVPFYRNHNTYAALPQEPYRWESIANASRIAIAARYTLLPYWYTLFANSSMAGLPPVEGPYLLLYLSTQTIRRRNA